MSIYVKQFFINVSDSIGASESVTAYPKQLSINVSDAVGAGELIPSFPGQLKSGDDIVLTEFITALVKQMFIDVSDGMEISEAVTIFAKQLNINVTDNITLTELVQFFIDKFFIDVSDSVALSESINFLLKQLNIDVSNNLTISEAIDVRTSGEFIEVNNPLTVTEAITILVKQLFIGVSDAIELSEAVTLLVKQLSISVSDNLTLTELVTLNISGAYINANDLVSLAEVITIFFKQLVISVNDSVALTDAVTVVAQSLSYNLIVNDIIGLSESITVEANPIIVECGELIVWHDSDDGRVFLLYKDPTVGVRKVELHHPLVNLGDGGITNYTQFSDAGSISFNGTARINWAKITAASITQGAGGHSGTTGDTSGLVGDLTVAFDGNYYHIDEVAAGFDVIIHFTSVTAFNWVQCICNYRGTVSHAVMVQVYNWITTTYDSYRIVPCALDEFGAGINTQGDSGFFIPDDTNYIGTGGDAGKVNIRILHSSSGNAAHDFDVDCVALYQ